MGRPAAAVVQADRPPCCVETSEKALGRVGAALGASGSPGGRAELLVLRKSLSPAGPPPDKPFSFAGH